MLAPGRFISCTKLYEIKIPGSVKAIGEKAFANCTSMPSIFIPSSVELIGEKAFHNCYNLTVFVEKYSYANQYCIDKALSFVDMLEY